MNQILITHVTNLLNLTKEGKIKPKEYSLSSIIYDGIEIQHNVFLKPMIIIVEGNQYVILNPPKDLRELFAQVATDLVDKKKEKEEKQLDAKLTDIIDRLYYNN